MEEAFFKAEGFCTIRDKITGEVLLDGKKNAIHLGNLSAAIVQSLSSEETGFIRYMAFGNGGSLISSTGEIIYRQPNVSPIRNSASSLYNETFKKEIVHVTGDDVFPVLSNSTYSDIGVVVTLKADEPNISQQSVDRADLLTKQSDNSYTYVGAGDAVFDELALYSGVPNIPGALVNNTYNAILLTHLVFHPIQKAANRVLEIDYTIRIQLT